MSHGPLKYKLRPRQTTKLAIYSFKFSSAFSLGRLVSPCNYIQHPNHNRQICAYDNGTVQLSSD